MSEKVIGVYPLFNTGGICVHAIDYAEDKVLASVNGENPEWCEMAEKPQPEEDGSENGVGLFVRLLFRAVLRGHTHVNLKREGLHESDC